MAFGIEEQVLWLDVTVCNALAVEVGYSIQHLLETAFDFAWAHSTAGRSKVSTRFKSKVRCPHQVLSQELSIGRQWW